jgi:hypothetical protein
MRISVPDSKLLNLAIDTAGAAAGIIVGVSCGILFISVLTINGWLSKTK